MHRWVEIIKEAAIFIELGDITKAKKILHENYPFRPKEKLGVAVSQMGLSIPESKRGKKEKKNNEKRSRRKLTTEELLAIFKRDGYSCCYSGRRLVLPPALVLLSVMVPEEFPCTSYPNCPLASTHIGMWSLYPSPDHVKAFSDDGGCTSENLVTTSSAVNMIKSRFSLDDLNWSFNKPQPELEGWDGLGSWFLRMIDLKPELLNHPEHEKLFKDWRSALSME